MQTRRFGRTGHHSTLAIFGAAAFWQEDQAQADATMRQVIEAGINHIDVAPSYGVAEERLGPWLATERERFFLGCKTMERSQKGAAAELRRSLERLQVEHFDLYQIHAVTSMAELDEAMRRGGALDAMVEARQAGLIRFIGITGHGVDSPAIFIEALQRFDFDSVLFPVNFIQYANPVYRQNSEESAAPLPRQGRGRDGDQDRGQRTMGIATQDAHHVVPAVRRPGHYPTGRRFCALAGYHRAVHGRRRARAACDPGSVREL